MTKYLEAVDRTKALAREALEFLWKNPETGYREWKAQAYLTEKFRALGYELTEAGNIPGFYTDLDTGRPGPTVLVMGEMDALQCETHPEADPETGAVHSCGHCCQAAGLLGLAAALKEPGILDGWCGRIRLMATPAEELIEVGFREGLRAAGTIKYLGGKVELMHRGFMDGCDLGIMAHSIEGPLHRGRITKGSNGCITKTITYHGVSAHAGAAPHQGVNALYAAQQGMAAINALRETFKDEDHIRIHPIITAGGTVVNAIPDRVVLEAYIRGATMDAIRQANLKVNRALAGSAAAMGCRLSISDRPGYSPRNLDANLNLVTKEAMELFLEQVDYRPNGWGTGCSDMGDVSMIMPAIHPFISGTAGLSHGNNYSVIHPDAAVDMTRLEISVLDILLRDGAARARHILDNFTPTFPSVESYFAFIDTLDMDKEAVRYNDDGTVTLDYQK